MINVGAQSAAPSASSKSSSDWLTKRDKHLLILSPAGKPIFSLHDDFGDSGLAMCSFLIALSSKTNNELGFVGSSRYNLLLVHTPGDVLLVAITSGKLVKYSTKLLRLQLDLLYNHVLFHVTQPALEHLFHTNPGYDLGGSLLGGTEAVAHSLLHQSETNLALLWDAIPLDERRRQGVAGKSPQVSGAVLDRLLAETKQGVATFALLVSGRVVANSSDQGSNNIRLLASLGPSATHITSMDFALLTSFVLRPGAHTTLMETWAPICLPGFDASGFFHCYAASVVPGTAADDVSLILCTSNPDLDHFHLLSERGRKLGLALANVGLFPPSQEDNWMLNLIPSALHVALKCRGQFLQQQVHASLLPLRSTSAYIVSRYASLLDLQEEQGGGAQTSSRVQLRWDSQPRDCACLLVGEHVHILALFSPLVDLTVASEELSGLSKQAEANHHMWFST